MEDKEINLKAPKKSPEHKAYWNRFIHHIAKRDNFKESHLTQLSILCDLLVNYDRCAAFVEEEGFVYESVGRNGMQRKNHPETDLMGKYTTQIKDYSKLLDITLSKDKVTSPGDGADEWD